MLKYLSYAVIAVMAGTVKGESLGRAAHFVGSPVELAGRGGAVMGRITRDIGAFRSCIDIHEVRNGQSACDASGCRIRCLPGYHLLGSGDAQVATLTCDHRSGELIFRGVTWRPELTLCAPHCPRGCHNGGRCAAPGRCQCGLAWSGADCSQGAMQGDDPNVGEETLPANYRSIDCEAGSYMPDGSTTALLVFRDGHWYYHDGRVLLGVDLVTCHKKHPGSHVTSKPPSRPETATPSISNKPRLSPSSGYGPIKLSSKTGSLRPEELRRNPKAPVSRPPSSAPSSFEVRRSRTTKKVDHNPRPSAIRRLPQPTLARPAVKDSRFMASSQPQESRSQKTEFDRFDGDGECEFPRFPSDLRATAVPSGRGLRYECAPGRLTLDGRAWVTVTCHGGTWYRTTGLPLTEEHVKCH